MAGSILGTAVRRVEDPDLVRGRGTFVDDLRPEGVLHCAFVRSPFAHAVLTSVDVSAAADASGVVAAYTAADLDLTPGYPFFEVNEHCARPPLATDRVRFVGEPVAVVVAHSLAAAVDAAELVDVDYEPLPVLVDPEAALAPGAPLQFETVAGNVAAGERSPGSDALDGATHVVRARFLNQRLAVAPIEGNAVLATPGGPDEDFDLTVHLSTQSAHLARGLIVKGFGLAKERVRVVAPHVGGGFGGKLLPSDARVVIGAALKLGRPVTFAETRSEAMLSMHGRGQVQYVELGLDADGHFTGLRCRLVGDCGAYAGFGGTMVSGGTSWMAPGVYRIPKVDSATVSALTNTAPMVAFRGAGRPEAASMIERIVDIAADELGLDPVELRRRNLPRPDEFPFTTPTGATYDSGDFGGALDRALELADVPALRAEQAERRERGDVRLLGIGVCCYVEVTAGGGSEYGTVGVDPTGSVVVRAGTSAHGQGHATTFSMLVADRLGVPMTSIRYEQADTALVPRGVGTFGSRSLQLGGNAVAAAADMVVERGRRLAASLLEAPADDLEVADGGFRVAGVPGSTVSWAEVSRRAEDDGEPLRAETDFSQDGETYPFGAHVSVVEVDVETGLVTPLRHVAVDDCGRILNPLIVAGQQYGGLAQGMSQALWEEFVYDAEGQPLTSTFADYCIPAATEFPPVTLGNTVTETPHNPLGAKGIGESATIGATPAVQNAVVDAVRHLGVRHLDMPVTPERVVRALAAAREGRAGSLWREPPAVFDDLPVATT